MNNNDLLNTTQTTEDWSTRTQQYPGFSNNTSIFSLTSALRRVNPEFNGQSSDWSNVPYIYIYNKDNKISLYIAL